MRKPRLPYPLPQPGVATRWAPALLLILGLVINTETHSTTGEEPAAPTLTKERLMGTWVREVRDMPGKREGLMFDTEGHFGLLGIHSMNGLYWHIDGHTVVVSTNTGRHPEPERSVLRVTTLDDDHLHLTAIGEGEEEIVIVERFGQILPGEACEPMQADASLENTYWRLVELNGDPVHTPEGQREIHMILSPHRPGVHGFSGCNRFFGGYEHEDHRLRFTDLAGTLMACPQGMDTEKEFLSTLQSTTRYAIKGERLELYAGDRAVARFQAVYLY